MYYVLTEIRDNEDNWEHIDQMEEDRQQKVVL